MKKLIFASLISLVAALLVSGVSFASYGSVACQPVYGGGETCVTAEKILINKTVLNPSTSKGGVEAFVDNLGINDPKYSPTQTVKFQLTVTNTGNSTLSEVTVYDIFPQYVDFVSGPGAFDKNSKTLTFKLSNLNPGEGRTYTLVGKVVAPASMPANQGAVCVVNQSIASSNGEESRDNSQFCIEKSVLTKGGFPVQPAPKLTQTPPTGPNELALIGLIPTGLAGLLLRKRASK